MYFFIGIIVFSFIIFILALISIRKCNKYERMIENKNSTIVSVAANNKIYKSTSYYQSDVSNISKDVKFNLNPRQFEVFCSLLFKELGYEVELTDYQYDGGKDIVLDNHILVECKKFITQQVGREICQKLIGAMVQNKADKAIIINTGTFHSNARKYAEQVDSLTLLGLNNITRMLNKIGVEKANYIYRETLKNK